MKGIFLSSVVISWSSEEYAGDALGLAYGEGVLAQLDKSDGGPVAIGADEPRVEADVGLTNAVLAFSGTEDIVKA